MVCKDTATIQLLQVSDNIKQRYKVQADTLPLSFLLTALNLTSQCDLSYKGSKNQRLHVELALVKTAYLTSAIKLAALDVTSDPLKKKN
jgi:DNA polymerase-3 subunit gamma/tau